MKINRSNPLHWLYLAIFSTNIVLVFIVSRLIPKSSLKPAVVFYGHKLNGNLKAILDSAQSSTSPGYLPYYLTMDPVDYWRLRKSGQDSVILGINPLHLKFLLAADVIVSSHGLHSLEWLLSRTSIKFVDVWHGIPFKGFDEGDFRTQHQYNETWVSSELLKDIYVEKFGFPEEIVKVTGYARTDKLLVDSVDPSWIKRNLKIDANDEKIILFAPTWAQDRQNRNIYPFDTSEEQFLERMSAFCESRNAICIVREHLNTKNRKQQRHPRIIYRSSEDFPDTEEILLISDILICDWSSIAFDYLLLNRPTLFLDVPAPFKKGFSLDDSYRYGHIVSNLDEMFTATENHLNNPENYLSEYAENHERVREAIYGEMADGQSSKRCLARLSKLL